MAHQQNRWGTPHSTANSVLYNANLTHPHSVIRPPIIKHERSAYDLPNLDRPSGPVSNLTHSYQSEQFEKNVPPLSNVKPEPTRYHVPINDTQRVPLYSSTMGQGNILHNQSNEVGIHSYLPYTQPDHIGNTTSFPSLNNFPDNPRPLQTKRKQFQPDKFDGKSTEWRDYIVHFESVSNWNGWGTSEKAQQLVMSLRGTAQKLLCELTPELTSDYDKLKEILMNRFNPPERETAYRCEFRNRKQNRQESASDFGYALQRLCLIAFPRINAEAREIYVIDQFINGLYRPELRSHVQFRHPSTLHEAIAYAVEYEAFDSAHGILKKPRFEGDNSVNSVSLETSHVSRSETVTLNDLAKLIEGLSKSIKHSRSRSNSKERFDLRKATCFNCQEKGHLANKCPHTKSSGN
ncbi:hypothetical protein ACF0H5_021561 [Mactra antiquata]